MREFKSFTEDLEALAGWELLEERGFNVYSVNARHVKNVSGRKSDVLDCQWLQQLMSYGLLFGAFRPKDEICTLRALTRQRDMLVKYQAQHILHMQKALTQMNVQLANVISDTSRSEDRPRHHRWRTGPDAVGQIAS